MSQANTTSQAQNDQQSWTRCEITHLENENMSQEYLCYETLSINTQCTYFFFLLTINAIIACTLFTSGTRLPINIIFTLILIIFFIQLQSLKCSLFKCCLLELERLSWSLGLFKERFFKHSYIETELLDIVFFICS